MYHVERVITDHRSLVNDNGIVLANGVIYDVLLVRRDGDVEEGMNGVCFEVRVEFFSVIGG